MSAVALRHRETSDVSPSSPLGSERAVSLAAGSLLVALGLRRRSLPGMLLAGVGGALLYRSASGHLPASETLARVAARVTRPEGLHVAQSFLIQRPAEELYRAWRDFESLPGILTHLESVEVLDERRSRWAVPAPSLAGGRVEWDAEIVRDEPGRAIAWRSLSGADVDHGGEIRFEEAPGHRGTLVRVSIGYRPPAGRLGDFVAKLFGVGAEQQLREDLRAFKRRMETGELVTVEGQPTGSCAGAGLLAQGGRPS
jgi:uncharacterized membrane protein